MCGKDGAVRRGPHGIAGFPAVSLNAGVPGPGPACPGDCRARSRAAYDRTVENIIALIPPVGVGLLFYVVIRSFVRADRTEREAVRRMEERSGSQPID